MIQGKNKSRMDGKKIVDNFPPKLNNSHIMCKIKDHLYIYIFFGTFCLSNKNQFFFRYTVSAETGYVAEVSYEGTPVYPPAPEPKKPLTE
jgi:hypothetical protein